jgi:hypothetical protein
VCGSIRRLRARGRGGVSEFRGGDWYGGVGRDYVVQLRLGRGSFETREVDELSKPEEAATARGRDVWR